MLPPAEAESLLLVVDRLMSNLRSATALPVTGEGHAARLLVEEREAFRALEAEATTEHFEHLREGSVGNVEISAPNLDALRDLQRGNANPVAAAAYPVLQSKGELLPSRLDSPVAAPRHRERRLVPPAEPLTPLYPCGRPSNILRSGGMTAQDGRLRAKIAILGRNDDGSSREPA
jgi:hypothetical protein